jgi:hypothetical protein
MYHVCAVCEREKFAHNQYLPQGFAVERTYYVLIKKIRKIDPIYTMYIREAQFFEYDSIVCFSEDNRRDLYSKLE